MAETLLYFTELLSLPVYDLKGRRIGRVKDAAAGPLDPSLARRPLSGGRRRRLAFRPLRPDRLDLARRHPLERRKALPVSLRRVHAAHRARSAGPADHRRQRPQGGPRQRRHLRNPHGRRARHARRCSKWISASAASCAGCFRAWSRARWIRRLQQPDRAAIPSAGNSATSWSPTRSAACG